MPKRTVWLVTGVAVGAGTSLWAERRLRRSMQDAAARLQPDALVAEVGRSARQAAEATGDRFRDAFSSGRDEMHRREEELWADLAAQGVARQAAPGVAGDEGDRIVDPVEDPPAPRRGGRDGRGRRRQPSLRRAARAKLLFDLGKYSSRS